MTDRTVTGAIGAATIGLVFLFRSMPTSYLVFAPAVLLGGLLLSGRWLLTSFGITTAVYCYVAFVEPGKVSGRPLTGAVALIVTMGVVVLLDRVWDRAGLPQQTASTLLTDLRRRHEVQSHMPPMPPGWTVDAKVEPAYGDSFCGDVVVGCRQGDRFNAAVLDVSGKGSTAGSRAVLLGGAVSGLVGALEASAVLPAVNDYLVRQGWNDGFATATHLSVDLDSGEFSLGSAGHPAAVRYHSGAGRWCAMDVHPGVVLGILEDQHDDDYPRYHGVLERGDAILLYSDGLVEDPNTDVSQGLDRLLGIAEREFTGGAVQGLATRICDEARSGEADDRTVLIIYRG
ncbi:PP2C family protein-serine/threonine phosphatase [Calidifontibacter terrae]